MDPLLTEELLRMANDPRDPVRQEWAREELVRRTYPWVTSLFARRVRDPHVILDLTQDTFLKLVRPNQLAQLKHAGQVVRWLGTVAIRIQAKWTQRQRRQGLLVPLEWAREEADQGEPPEARIDQTERLGVLYLLIAELPPRRQKIVCLRCFDDPKVKPDPNELSDPKVLKYEEIGSRLGIDPGTVASELSAARRTLAARLQQIAPELMPWFQGFLHV